MTISPGDATVDAPGAAQARSGARFPRLGRLAVLAGWLLVAAFTVARIAFAATYELRVDETYYWTWSGQNVLSFIDHPPMVAWFVRIGRTVFGDTPFGVRALFVLSITLVELVMADLVRRGSGSRGAVLLVVLSIECSISYGLTGIFAEPSLPLALFAALAAWCLARIEATEDPRWWAGVGAFAGLALLSKYTAVFFAPALAAYLLIPRRNRRWLKSAWFWSAGVLVVVLFLPVLVWNAQHDWASFRFQGARATATTGASWNNFSTYLLVTLVYYGALLVPVTVWGSFALLWQTRRGKATTALFLASSFLVPLFYVAERSRYQLVMATWTVPIWPFGFAALALAAFSLAERGRPWLRRFAIAGVVLAVPLNAILLAHGTLDNRVWGGTRDPLAYDTGYAAAAEAIKAIAEQQGATWIATSDFTTYGVLRWNLRDTIPVLQVTERSRYLGWAEPDPSGYAKGPGLYVHGKEADPLVTEATGGRNVFLADVYRRWRGEQIAEPYHVELMPVWTPELHPAPDSPFFRWPDLTRYD